MKASLVLVLLLLNVPLAGCASRVPLAPEGVPAVLQVSPGQIAFLQGFATGVQIYECSAKSNTPNDFEWVFRAPEATLADPRGHVIVKHYAGPTWESMDGSTVVGSVVAKDPGPDPTSIPWLLLSSTSHTGVGTLSTVTSIQRLQTQGGIAPLDHCGADNLKAEVRVPYTATYRFYQAG